MSARERKRTYGAAACLRGFAALLVAVGLVTGCGTFNVRVGKRPDVGVLQGTLKPGASTREQVRAALGEPYGRGRTMLPWHASPRTVWSYYYEEATISLGGGESDDRRIFLFVFLDGDRYDGHLWFSSLR
jgi:hypothetical protein